MDTKNTISAIIVDGKTKNINIIRKLLSVHCLDVDVIGTSSSASDMMNLIRLQSPDVMFLDSDLVSDEFLKFIGSEKCTTELVFMVESKDFAIKAFEYSALYCIQKPFCSSEFIESINRLKQKKTFYSFKRLESIYREKKGSDGRIMLPDLLGFRLVNVSQIVRCEADTCYTNVYLDDGEKIVSSKPLWGFVEVLPLHLFCRVHSKHLINLNYLQQYVKGRGGIVILLDGTTVEVSERKKKDFIEQLAFFGYSFLECHQRTNGY
ncbi:hypothetical protein BZG02_19845 [Labilibaculum filiforme]|uniref:Response regulatory domain-containing protein n=1 Tax=Labilibaculum filiforme TaxID=1940526 RepID=A0A2N3HQJ4_9BACT|nr:LytTR family DNA-binding domain-containing protein [Labilibaculum filiforme]PKQ60309.1 hypothetical protein BZG02_19845 [Labilibaculum filiforme]